MRPNSRRARSSGRFAPSVRARRDRLATTPPRSLTPRKSGTFSKPKSGTFSTPIDRSEAAPVPTGGRRSKPLRDQDGQLMALHARIPSTRRIRGHTCSLRAYHSLRFLPVLVGARRCHTVPGLVSWGRPTAVMAPPAWNGGFSRHRSPVRLAVGLVMSSPGQASLSLAATSLFDWVYFRANGDVLLPPLAVRNVVVNQDGSGRSPAFAAINLWWWRAMTHGPGHGLDFLKGCCREGI